ncbi:hypothetical protein D3C78_1955930 [compost metagenome]
MKPNSRKSTFSAPRLASSMMTEKVRISSPAQKGMSSSNRARIRFFGCTIFAT